MKNTILPVAISLAWLAASLPAQESTNDDTADLLKLEQHWASAVAKHDAAFIERVEDEAYVYTDATGNVAHKADDLAAARAGDVKIESFKLSDMKVQLHGGTAVVTGQTTLAGSDHGGTLNGTYRWTDVFVRRPDGAWQVISSQATTVGRPEDAPIIVLPAATPPAGSSTDTDE